MLTKDLHEFCDRWKDRGYEKGDSQQFWLQLLTLCGYQNTEDVLFEYRLPSGGYIDVWIPESGVLVEQKNLNTSLDQYVLRRGKVMSVLDQALDYTDELPRVKQPRFVVTCNFQTFRVYDRDKYAKSELETNFFEFTLDELKNHPEYLSFITAPEDVRYEKEKRISIQAGTLIAKLYDMLLEAFVDPTDPKSLHALNVLCVRLVFCLFCEDAGLFPKDSFYNYLKDIPARRLRVALIELFQTLDTEVDQRSVYNEDTNIFPYVNGGLFKGDIEIPNFTESAKHFLLEDVSKNVDWSCISPTIFGGIFESTLNPVTRRTGGMHYTSPENIHKVIDPLFLDDFKERFESIKNNPALTDRQKTNHGLSTLL